MTAITRRRLTWTLVRIVLLTMLALVVERSKALEPIENVVDNLRIRKCQYYIPPPSDQLIHMDIDETALEQIGRWPWDRDQLAEILEEIRLAGPKVLAMDIILPEPSKIRFDAKGKPIDPDAILAEEIKRFDRVLLPASVTFDPGVSPDALDVHLQKMLSADPEIAEDRCAELLKQNGIDFKSQASLDHHYVSVRPQAIYSRIKAELNQGNTDRAKVRQKLLPHSDAMTVRVVDHLFEEAFDSAWRDRSYLRFTIAAPPGLPPVLASSGALTPVAKLTESARYGAFIDYLPDHIDGTVRSIPLVAEFRGRLLPQMGLAVACAMLDANINQIRLTSDSVIIPCPGKTDCIIPVSSRDTPDYGRIGMFMNVPMFGKKDSWETMYDVPQYQRTARHISAFVPWQACQTRRRMESNEGVADSALVTALSLTNPPAAKAYADAPLTGEKKEQLIQTTLAVVAESIKGMVEDNLQDKESKELLANFRHASAQLQEVARQRGALAAQLADLRAQLHEKLNGKAVFLGGTATGYVDIIPTTLDARCPGVVLHGAVFNAIMTRKMWRVAPHSYTYLIIIAFGLLIGILVTNLSPAKALIATLVICLAYLAFNGFYLFDARSLVVGTSGPLLAAVLVWSGVTIPNFIREIADRNRITRRFSNYVDPSLVNYVLAHPETEHFAGETREMTMGFTDLAGFTTLTESLGTRTIPLLAEYIGKMVPIIRDNQGYVSRLMGDGIYFFFNAPNLDEDHAYHSVAAVLAMHAVVDEMNLTLPERGYPKLGMRAGICSGKVIVGDAGSTAFSDYTAMGDAVNTAARLEGANKVFGSRTLVIRRTIELLNDRFLYRPIANLRVAGKTVGVDVYEPLCRIEDATPELKQLAELSAQVVNTYQAGDFAGCIAAVNRMEEACGISKFTALYREMSEDCLVKKPGDFCGQVIMTEK